MSRSSSSAFGAVNVTAAGPFTRLHVGRELPWRDRIAVVGRGSRQRRRARRREVLVDAGVDHRRGVAGGRDQSIHDELVRQRRDVDLAVGHRRRAELREVAERVPRGVLLTVPELARHVASRRRRAGCRAAACDWRRRHSTAPPTGSRSRRRFRWPTATACLRACRRRQCRALRARRRREQAADQPEHLERIAGRPDIDRRAVGRAAPVHRRAVHARRGRGLKALDDLAVVAGAEVPHVGAIDDVHHAFLAAADDQVRVGDEQRILDPEILVRGVQERPVVRREPVEQRAGRTDLDEAVAEVPPAGVAVERSVSRQRVEVAGRIRRQPAAGLPDAAEPSVRRRVVDHDLLKARRVVSQDPAVVRALVAVRGPGDVDGAVIDQQAGSLIVRPRVERDVVLRVAAVAGPGHAGLNDDGAAGPLAAVANIERVQPLHERAVLLRPRDEVDRLGRRIDRGRAANPDVAGEVDVGAAGLTDIGARHRQDAGGRVRVGDAPQRRRSGGIVGIERVDAVVVGRDVDDVPDADAGDVHAVDVQGLPVDLVVDGPLEQLAELADVDVGGREDRFRQVRAGPRRVVVLRDDARLRERGHGEQQGARKDEEGRCAVKHADGAFTRSAPCRESAYLRAPRSAHSCAARADLRMCKRDRQKRQQLMRRSP